MNVAKDQLNCGSCWAFSATAVIEGAYAIKHKKSIYLSEQQIIDCDFANEGCDGGRPY
jgi:C1A family cysteine protease